MRMTNPFKNETSRVDDKDANLAMIVHDLKNPVSSVSMAVKLLENKELSPLNDYQKELVENVETGLKYMKSLIEDILDEYKFKNNKYIIEKHPSNIVHLIEGVTQETRYLFYDKSQKLQFNTNIKNKIINIDDLAIQRVINNLFVNAVKYSPPHSIILLNVLEANNKIVFSIENPGLGISLKNPNDIFEKFVSCNMNSKSTASGLGLYIVKKIIEAHRGEIYVETEAGKFTRITFILPRK